MASRVCSVATRLFVCLFILIHLARCEARATHSHCAPACHCYQVDGLRAANCSSLHNISNIAHSVEVLRVDEFGDHLSLKDGLFSPLINLKRLYLSHLGLHKVYPGAFSGLNQLQVLDLSHNRFAVPSEIAKAVNQLPKLERFLLRGNPLGKAPLLSSKQLVFLDLGSCKITNISDSSLKNLSGLKHLKLDNNRLTVIKPKWFPQSIVSLDLSNNYIRHFSRHEFQNLSHLEHIEISGNPIHCTCETLKIRYDFIMNNVVLCVYPEEYRGVDLFSLKKRNFCPKTVSDNRFRRHLADDEYEDDDDDYYSDEADDEQPFGQDVHEKEQGNEGSAKSDASKPVESEDIHSSEHVHDAVDPHHSHSHDEDKEQEDTDTFPASEEDKEMGESVKNEHADASPHASEGEEDKSKEDTDNSPANEEETDEAESVVNDMSNKNGDVDLAPHASADDGNKDDEDTDSSPANEEKHDAEFVIEDNKNEDADAALHASEDDGNKEEEDNNSPTSEEETDKAESVLDDTSIKTDHVDAAPHASEDDADKDEDTDNSPANEDNDNSPASKEETNEAETVSGETPVKNDHVDAAPHASEDDGNKEGEDNNSPASKEETDEAESVVDDTSIKIDHIDLEPADNGDKDEEAKEEVIHGAESAIDDNKEEHADTAPHLSESVVNKEEEDTNNSQASVEERDEAEDEVDDTSNKHEDGDTVLHGSQDDGNKDVEEETDNSPTSEEVKEIVGSVLDDTSSRNEHDIDTAAHSSEGAGSKEDEDTGDEKEEAVSVLDGVSSQNEPEDIAPHSVAAEKEEDNTNVEEVKHEHVVSTSDESSAQNEDQDIPSHISGGDLLEEEGEENKENRDEMKESDDDNKNEDNMGNVLESEHHKQDEEEEANSNVDNLSVVEEDASHATMDKNEPKENDETDEGGDDSLNELSKEDVAGNASEASGEDESNGQDESQTPTNSGNEETHILLSPASATQNETSAGEEDQSSPMVVFGSDEDQVDHDTEVDELHNISSDDHKTQDSEDGSTEEGNTGTEVDELHNISSNEHKVQNSEDRGLEEEQGLHVHHEVHASESNETYTSSSTEEDKDIDDLMKWSPESSGSVVVESQEEGENYSEEETEDHSEFFGLPPTSENATEPSVLDVESASNETHAAGARNETAIFMDMYEETGSESSRAAYDLSEELEDVSGKHDYMFEEIEGSGTHEDSTPILLEGSGFEESVTESSTEDTSESSGYPPLIIGVHSVIHTSNQVENDTETGVVDDLERTTVSPLADNSLELEEESSGHGSIEEIPIIAPAVESHDSESAVTTEKEPVVEEEVVSRVNVYNVEGAGPPLIQTTTPQPEMEETSTYRPAEVEIESESGANETHGDIRQESDGEQNAVQDSASNSAGSYIVLGIIMCIIVILLAYAVIRSHQKRKRAPRKDVENPGRELQDVSKPLIDSKPPPSKEEPVDETREPLMSKEKEAALSSELSDNEPVKNGDLKHVPEVVVEKQPHTETDSPAPAQNKDANGTAKKPEPNGTLTAPLVNGNGVGAPVSPSSGRVKVVAKELPDSVAKRPILIVNRGTDPTV